MFTFIDRNLPTILSNKDFLFPGIHNKNPKSLMKNTKDMCDFLFFNFLLFNKDSVSKGERISPIQKSTTYSS